MPHDYETPQILHDAPLRRSDQHHFHFDEFAVTLCRLIAAKDTRTPLTIGVSGSWGSGKTTLLQRVKQKLDEAGDLSDATKRTYWGDNENPKTLFRPCRTVWFDAWKYADEDELLVALIRVILATMAQGNLGEKFWSKVLDKNAPRYNVIAALLSFFKFKVGTNFEVSFDLEKYKEETPFAKNTAFFDYFDAALEELIARWVHDTGNYRQIDEQKGALVIFVDDLDRCLPEKAVQVLEAIKLFLDKHGCVFVLGADLNVVRSAVETHYHNPEITGQTAGDYLEKIIQLRFELPPIVDAQMGKYLEDDQFAAQAVDAEVRRNWQILVTGADINPRKVKTVINDLSLRWTMLVNSGQAAGVDRNDFTHWNVLMRVAPDDFKRQVVDLPPESRRKFVDDAVKWVQGDQAVAGFFKAYEDARLLKRVLNKVQFSGKLTPDVLDAFVHLTAPPAQPAVPEMKPETETKAVLEQAPGELEFTVKGMPAFTREARGEASATANVQVWGGMEFVCIPGGKFLMGSKDENRQAYDDEKPQHSIEVLEYWLARYPVTNDQFARFIEAERYVTTAEKEGGWSTEKREYVKDFDWRHPQGPKTDLIKKGDHPVVQISWYDALEYCKWLNTLVWADFSSLGMSLRLPTEAEWEKGARGEYGNEWPWGNEFDKNKCNSDEGEKGDTTPVGAYSPQGDSPYGVVDMVGNVWEWCHSLYKPYPYKVDHRREDESTSGIRVPRGGSFWGDAGDVRCARRLRLDSRYRGDSVGFRVVVAPALG
jgi:formylglycine-generating enzyme required for sulfatase activity